MPSLLLPRQTDDSTFFGVLDLASGVDLFMQGVLCAQFAHYMNVNEKDSRGLKFFVAGLALLTTLKSVQILAIRWMQNGRLFENLEAVSNLWHAEWISQITLLLEAIIAFYVQMFFSHRLWALSHNVYVVVVAMILFGFALAAASVSTQVYADIPLSTIWGAVHLGFAMGGDVLQTGSIVFYLLRHSKTVLRHGPTESMLDSLMRLTIQSAAPGTLCALINFATTLATLWSHAKTPSGLSALWVVAAFANVMLPKLYAVAAMWTLNSRKGIRSVAVTNTPPTHLDFGTAEVGTSGSELPNSLHAGVLPTTGSLSTTSFCESKNVQPDPPQWDV
ncbi:hypothetical protein MVEN_01088800 [Mycena venus]|uniref:DUF6534 domain-containing protein n=1 Tax=Mycena venus TaxID=2733690 RepID=A0A8H6Y9G9_9AGAR|nr:hypothetical protein MVEN_01088800 [Mycena venus]